MREYIKSRNAEFNEEEFLLMACTIHEKLIVQDGYGLASEKTKDDWKEITLTASISIELADDLQEIKDRTGADIDIQNEMNCVLIHEIKNEAAIKDYTNIAYVKFTKAVKEFTFAPILTITIGCI